MGKKMAVVASCDGTIHGRLFGVGTRVKSTSSLVHFSLIGLFYLGKKLTRYWFVI